MDDDGVEEWVEAHNTELTMDSQTLEGAATDGG